MRGKKFLTVICGLVCSVATVFAFGACATGETDTATLSAVHEHAWKTEYSYDETKHWLSCEGCEEAQEKETHSLNGVGKCTVCAYETVLTPTACVLYDIIDGQYASVRCLDGNDPAALTITNLVLADTYQGLPVTEIQENAFKDCTSITSVVIPKTITTMKEYAFTGCTSLAEVYIFDLTRWCDISFEFACNPLNYAEKLYLDGELITDLVIPDAVTEIKAFTFAKYMGVTSVSLPETLTKIGDLAFADCTNLATVTFPKNLTSIGDNAFRSTALSRVFLPETVTEIGEAVFDGCENLNIYEYKNLEYVASETNPYFALVGMRSKNSSYTIHDDTKIIAGGALRVNHSLTTITIPDGVVSIGKNAFSFCGNLSSVVLGKGVRVIGRGAFGSLENLKSVTGGENVVSIGTSAFDNCKNLITAELGTQVQTIENYAFNNCESLMDLTIGSSVQTIGDKAFYDCRYLTGLEFSDSLISIGKEAFGGAPLTAITLANSVETIGKGAFYSASLTVFCEAKEKPSGWDSEWNQSNAPVVWDCKNNDLATDGYIYEVVDGVRYMLKDGEAIVPKQSRGFTEVNIPSVVMHGGQEYKVTTVQRYAFENCGGFSITLGSNLKKIEKGAFRYCSGLKVYITDLTDWCAIQFEAGGNPIVFAHEVYYNGSLLRELVIPENVTAIGDYAFTHCRQLTNVVLHDGVTSIGAMAFDSCEQLSSVTLGNGLQTIGEEAFAYCARLTEIFIPQSVTTIGSSVFGSCGRLKIFCEAEAQPSGWDSRWNSSNRPVTWASTRLDD